MNIFSKFIVILTLISTVNLTADLNNNIYRQIATEISNINNSTNSKNIAIFPFYNDDGKYISEKITIELSDISKVHIVEKEKIIKVIQDHKIYISETIDTITAIKIGELLGVNALITGSLATQNGKTNLLINIIDTKTGLINSSISKEYVDEGKKNEIFTYEWKVIKTADYFINNGVNYKKLLLNIDDTYELHLLNNVGKLVIFKGFYKIEENNIDFYPQELFVDNNKTYLPSRDAQKGTIYLVADKLYFTVLDMQKKNRKRLDAMKGTYRNIAERN